MALKFKENYNGMFIRFRKKRMAKFYALLSPSGDSRVLDIGGMPSTWNEESQCDRDFPVTLINLRRLEDFGGERFTAVVGDATNLPFGDKSFDIAFSNSVIEHLGSWDVQVRFAQEVSRVAPKFWVQTPAKSFPIEPHYLAPFIHYFPKKIQRLLVRNFTVWGWSVRPNTAQVDSILDELRLLSYREFVRLFPNCAILKEKFLGLTKSYIAVRA